MSVTFKYEARHPSGRTERGRLSASDRSEALRRLHGRHLTPLSIKPTNRTDQSASISDRTARDFSRAIAQMLRAGLPLSQALRFASEELAPHPARLAASMREAAERGDQISSAIEDYSGASARLLRGVVIAGETSGRLAEALEMAAIWFTRSEALRGRLQTTLIYPCFVIVATLATLACFLLVIVPTLGQAFEGVQTLPESTRALLRLSEWLAGDGALQLLIFVTLSVAAAASAPGRAAFGALMDNIALAPWAFGIAPRLEFASFAGLAALSLDAGVPGAAAFASAAEGIRNKPIRERLARAAAAMRIGEPPAAAIERLVFPPRALARLMRVGEETGKLAEALKQASTLLASEAEQRLERLGAIAGPIVTLALGGLVAGVVMSIFLGLLSLSDVAAL